MRVVILHNEVAPGAAEDERDVLVQVAAVRDHLTSVGHDVRVLPCTLDLAQLDRRLAEQRPDVVFNLVEALGGTDRLAWLVPGLLEARRIPFTGSSPLALQLTSDKLRAKQWLNRCELPTPDCVTRDTLPMSAAPRSANRYILKAVHEHASFGIDDRAVVQPTSSDSLLSYMDDFEQRWRCEVFAERFVEGREFNLSLLASADGVQVLPPAEIEFAGYPDDKPRIVGYQAKWASDSFEYVATPRRFDFSADDQPLLDTLATLARACWRAFGLRGYARVDFRVDQQAQPWILEINTNPCLSPDAGFAAALARADISYPQALERILVDAARDVGSVQP